MANRKATFAKRQRETDLKDRAKQKEDRRTQKRGEVRVDKGPQIAWDEQVYAVTTPDEPVSMESGDQADEGAGDAEGAARTPSPASAPSYSSSSSPAASPAPAAADVGPAAASAPTKPSAPPAKSGPNGAAGKPATSPSPAAPRRVG
jgi:hypothetical protein